MRTNRGSSQGTESGKRTENDVTPFSPWSANKIQPSKTHLTALAGKLSGLSSSSYQLIVLLVPVPADPTTIRSHSVPCAVDA